MYVAEGLYALAILACPVGMCLMMWLMMRGNKRADRPQSGPGTSQTDAEVAQLRAELDVLRATARDRQAPPADSGRPH
ncbi:hypothetical protein EV643_12440 [Kribbella sp. VKM Ac-2527]|uniref:DUF2933 family protein n=1 Tax=Kribbella caucasensis TaxID=2512215 RepID=A0A4R6JGK4_9ACTN|nr:hypothetical protein [Kribbella sp. VKM Ac-2527]TDO35154.1 hypothetical protein EV643_12440 [Kribbella sp. VKM Ac-2527]